MEWKRMRISVVAALVVSIGAVGCGSEDPLQSGNVVASFQGDSFNPGSIPFTCIQFEIVTLGIRPADGECFGGLNDGLPCGSPNDCLGDNGDCIDMLCVGGVKDGNSCVDSADCLDDTNTCAGLAPGSETPRSQDPLQNFEILQMDGEQAFFIDGPCNRCSQENPDSARFCATDEDCTVNRCVDGDDPILEGAICADRCCVFTTSEFLLPCEQDSDCPVNTCEPSASPLPSGIFSEGAYYFRTLTMDDLRLASSVFRVCRIGQNPCETDADCDTGNPEDRCLPYDIPCEGLNVVPQFEAIGERLTFEVNETRANNIRMVINIGELQGLLGVTPTSPDSADCAAALNNFPDFFSLQSE